MQIKHLPATAAAGKIRKDPPLPQDFMPRTGQIDPDLFSSYSMQVWGLSTTSVLNMPVKRDFLSLFSRLPFCGIVR
jgi:hypothetical protein